MAFPELCIVVVCVCIKSYPRNGSSVSAATAFVGKHPFRRSSLPEGAIYIQIHLRPSSQDVAPHLLMAVQVPTEVFKIWVSFPESLACSQGIPSG